MGLFGIPFDEIEQQIPHKQQTPAQAPDDQPFINGPFSGTTINSIASCMSISKKPRFAIYRAAMQEFVGDHTLLIIIPPLASTNTYDDIAEQSKQQPEMYKDHLSDEAVELVQYGQGVLEGYDLDVDRQIPTPDVVKD